MSHEGTAGMTADERLFVLANTAALVLFNNNGSPPILAMSQKQLAEHGATLLAAYKETVVVPTLAKAFEGHKLPSMVLGCRTLGEALEALMALEELREPEGASITIFCDNPDFGGPNAGVDMVFDFEEMPTRFSGDSVLEALRAAVVAKRAQANGG